MIAWSKLALDLLEWITNLLNRVQTALMWCCRVKTVFIKFFGVWCWMSTKVSVLVSRPEGQGLGLGLKTEGHGLGLDLKTWWPRSRSWFRDLKAKVSVLVSRLMAKVSVLVSRLKAKVLVLVSRPDGQDLGLGLETWRPRSRFGLET